MKFKHNIDQEKGNKTIWIYLTNWHFRRKATSFLNINLYKKINNIFEFLSTIEKEIVSPRCSYFVVSVSAWPWMFFVTSCFFMRSIYLETTKTQKTPSNMFHFIFCSITGVGTFKISFSKELTFKYVLKNPKIWKD